MIRECTKATKGIEARRPSGEEEKPWKNLSLDWVKNQNENALKEMKVAGVEVGSILPKLKDHVHEITSGLFGLFDFFKLDRAAVDRIVDDFLGNP